MIVLSSGCLKGTQCPVVISPTEGVLINKLEASYYKVPVGGEVLLELDLQNMGNAKAEDVEIKLWSHPGFNLGAEESDTITLNKPLYPPDMDICSAGDAKIIAWHLKAGCDPMRSTLAVSVEYDYTSEGWASILLTSEEEAGKKVSKKETGQNFPSAGPLQVEIEPMQTEPVIITSSGIFDIRIHIRNVGQGLVGQKGEGDVESITVTTSGPCYLWNRTSNKEISESLVWDDVSLRLGKQEVLKTASLKYKHDKLVRDYCTVNVKADYRYRAVETTLQEVGIYGTAEQVERCRAQS